MNATIAQVNALGRTAAVLDSRIAKMPMPAAALAAVEPLMNEMRDLERQVGELYGERKPDLDRLRAGLLCLIATYRRVILKVDPKALPPAMGDAVHVRVDTTDGPRVLPGTVVDCVRGLIRVRLEYTPLHDFTGDHIDVHPNRLSRPEQEAR